VKTSNQQRCSIERKEKGVGSQAHGEHLSESIAFTSSPNGEKENCLFSIRIRVKKQIDYLTIYTGGYMGNSKGRKAQGAWHKADWERLRAWGKKKE